MSGLIEECELFGKVKPNKQTEWVDVDDGFERREIDDE